MNKNLTYENWSELFETWTHGLALTVNIGKGQSSGNEIRIEMINQKFIKLNQINLFFTQVVNHCSAIENKKSKLSLAFQCKNIRNLKFENLNRCCYNIIYLLSLLPLDEIQMSFVIRVCFASNPFLLFF